MALNYIWLAFFIIAFAVALFKTIFEGDLEVWSTIMSSSFSSAATAFEISLGLTGILSLWLGLMKVGERAGVIGFFGRMISPLFCRLFPGVPKGHPAMGSIFMNVSANMLGLDNAATPLGLKAMQELQTLNKEKDTATDAMIMFLILNASGLCFIPIGIMMYRAQAGAGMAAIIAGIVWFFSGMDGESVARYSGFIANALLFGVIIAFLGSGLWKRINVYESFIEGAREGFKTAVTIIPYLVAILVAIGMFRASGAMDLLTKWTTWAVASVGLDTEWVEALPTALMKPLSGSGSRGLMVDLMTAHGADAFVSRVSASIQGSTDTMFYVLAVYFGSVGIRKTRYAVTYALMADIAGSLAGIFAAYLFFK